MRSPFASRHIAFVTLLTLALLPALCLAAPLNLYVSPTGDDSLAGTSTNTAWRTIQKAASSATPGSLIHILAGTYREMITVTVSGAAPSTPTIFRSEGAVLNGRGLKSSDYFFFISNRHDLVFENFEIKNHFSKYDSAGFYVEGASSNIQFLNNRIHDLKGKAACGIAIYGTALQPATNFTVRGNEIYKCQPAPSETIIFNGNVQHYLAESNYIHEVNNIGIVNIGGEKTCSDPAQDAARDGVVRCNRVWRARSSYGGGYAAGIYVDGGRNILLERNTCWDGDVGLEVGAENPGALVTGVIVRDNLAFKNSKRGFGLGGYEQQRGRVNGTVVVNNTFYRNDRQRAANAELVVEYGTGNSIRNNIFCSGKTGRILSLLTTGQTNDFDYNLYFADGAKNRFYVDKNSYTNWTNYLSAVTWDTHSLFASPRFVAPLSDHHLQTNSPAINAGDPARTTYPGETDLDDSTRILGHAIDLGAYEMQ